MTDACLWTGGRVFTGRRYVEALLIEGGRVVGVGPLDPVRRLAPTGAEHRDLAGRLIVPGLVDPHLHLAEMARMKAGPRIAAAPSMERLLHLLSEWAASHPGGTIVGRGWDPERWVDHRWPESAAIDRVVRDRPVILYHASGHAALVNSAALTAVGIDPGSSAPADPAVGRRPDGRPNGLLFEEAMRPLGPLAQAAIPIDAELLASALGELPAFGLTAVGTMATSAEELSALATLDSAGRLPVAVRSYLRLSDRALALGSNPRRAERRFAVVGVKAFLDGAFGPRTAWLSAPYRDDPDSSGLAVGSEADLVPLLEEVVAAGLSPALHAIGDRALARALRLLAPLSGRAGTAARIEHAALTPPELLPEIERVRPMLVVQPGFVWSDGWLADRLGPERARWAYAFRTLRRRGVRLAGSSDAPFDPVDPWRGVRAAVQRIGPEGRSANPDPGEALSAEEAMGLYTVEAAAALGLGSRGELVPGGAGDFVVLGVPDLHDALVRGGPVVDETWVDGRRAYRATDSPV